MTLIISNIEQVLRHRKSSYSSEFQCIHYLKNGTELDVSVTVSPILRNDNSGVGVAMIVKEITVLRNLEHRFVNTYEERINGFSRYIQENLVQVLTGIMFQTKSLEETVADSNPDISGAAKRIKHTLLNKINSLRSFLPDMAVVELDSHKKIILQCYHAY